MISEKSSTRSDRRNFSKHFVFDFWWKYPEKKHENFSENMLVGSKFSLISLWKPGRFAKTHIYSERGNFGTSSYDKNSTSIFFQKIGFSEGGNQTNFLKFQYGIDEVSASVFDYKQSEWDHQLNF